MTVYVDEAIHPYGRMLMCHMVADSREELFAMADAIGVARKWLQKKDQWHEHFDISKGKRAEAIKRGAIPITSRELVRFLRARCGLRGSPVQSLQENKPEQGSLLPRMGLHGDP